MAQERTPSETTHVVEMTDLRTTMRVRKARVKVVKGPDRGVIKDLQHQAFTIGGTEGADLVLTDPSVSRKHLEISPHDKRFILKDLGSTNGTFIRGLRIGQVDLSGGEEIEIGRSTILFSILDEHEELHLSQNKAFGTMVGRSLAMRQAFAVLERAASSEATLLLEGESGTGKDLAAENVHLLSGRKDAPFVVVDCGAVTPTLIESELFGHCKGSFTGAERDRPGAFESANGGTVFLDEISEIDLSIQPKLLRVLDKRESKRVGENTYRPVDVRIVAATNRDLAHEVEQGRFREDLFYRISVLRVRMPPLRNRYEDLIPLAKAFITKRDANVNTDEILTDQVVAMFLNHDWPGNVRELRNVVERLLLFPDHPETAIKRRTAWTHSTAAPTLNFLELTFRDVQGRVREHYEKAYLSAILDACNGVMSLAAKKSGLPRQTFYRFINKYKLNR